RRWEARCHGRHGTWGGSRGHHPLRAYCSLIGIALALRARALEPAARLRRDRHERRDPDTGIHGVEKVRAVAIEAIRHHILERKETFVSDRLQHPSRYLRLALKGQFSGDLAPDPSNGIRVGPPRLRQK